jgi:biopolymer transport protein ExbB/TolQ
MKKKRLVSAEFAFQVVALIVIVVVVQATYAMVIRPRASAVLEAQQAALELDPNYAAPRSLVVIIRDFEQEVCIILMLWAFAIMACKGIQVVRDRALLSMNLVPVDEGIRILPEDSRAIQREINALPEAQRRTLVPRAMISALHRFDSARNIQNVSEAALATCDAEGDRLESELSLIRYIAWAIPSVGFIGTVRGIGEALAQAHKAVEGDIGAVTESLGVAFNSTLIALLISIVVMFLVHQLQLAQERYVLDAKAYCEEKLIRHLHTG